MLVGLTGIAGGAFAGALVTLSSVGAGAMGAAFLAAVATFLLVPGPGFAPPQLI